MGPLCKVHVVIGVINNRNFECADKRLRGAKSQNVTVLIMLQDLVIVIFCTSSILKLYFKVSIVYLEVPAQLIPRGRQLA